MSGRPPRRVLIVDGYNVINARGRAAGNLADARDWLVKALTDYAGWSGQDVTVVFDACLQVLTKSSTLVIVAVFVLLS